MVVLGVVWRIGGVRGLKDKTCWFDGDFSAVWCQKVWVEVGWGQLQGWTKRVGLMGTFRLCGAGKLVLELGVSSCEG